MVRKGTKTVIGSILIVSIIFITMFILINLLKSSENVKDESKVENDYDDILLNEVSDDLIYFNNNEEETHEKKTENPIIDPLNTYKAIPKPPISFDMSFLQGKNTLKTNQKFNHYRLNYPEIFHDNVLKRIDFYLNTHDYHFDITNQLKFTNKNELIKDIKMISDFYSENSEIKNTNISDVVEIKRNEDESYIDTKNLSENESVNSAPISINGNNAVSCIQIGADSEYETKKNVSLEAKYFSCIESDTESETQPMDSCMEAEVYHSFIDNMEENETEEPSKNVNSTLMDKENSSTDENVISTNKHQEDSVNINAESNFDDCDQNIHKQKKEDGNYKSNASTKFPMPNTFLKFFVGVRFLLR